MEANEAVVVAIGAIVVVALSWYLLSPSKKRVSGLESSRIVLVRNAPSLVPA
jgi:hypothetical protein